LLALWTVASLGIVTVASLPAEANGVTRSSRPAGAAASLSAQPFDINDDGLYFLIDRLLKNTDAGQTPRYIIKRDPAKQQLILEFPFSQFNQGLPEGYSVGMQGIQKIEMQQANGSLIDIARVVITFDDIVDISATSVETLDNGRLILPYRLKTSSTNATHGGGEIVGTQSPVYSSSKPFSGAPTAPTAGPPSGNIDPLLTSTSKPVNVALTPIDFIEVEDKYLLLKARQGAPKLKVKKEFYLEKPNRFVVDLEPAMVTASLFPSEVSKDGNVPHSGITEWRGWGVRISQNNPTTVRVVIETEESQNFSIVRGEDNSFENSIIIEPSGTNKGFWDRFHSKSEDQLNDLTQLYMSAETIGQPLKFRLESEKPIRYRVLPQGTNTVVLELLNVRAPKEPIGFNVSTFGSIKSLSHVQATQGSRIIIELARPFTDLRSTPYTSENAMEISFEVPARQISLPKTTPVAGKKRFRIVVDAGHGGKDQGASREGVLEKTLNLDVTLKVVEELRERGYTVETTRNTDRFLSLSEITQVAASHKPDIFISVHHNSNNNADIHGIETYYYHGFSLGLANDLHKAINNKIPAVDRGVRKAKFFVINHTTVPSVLLELGYVSNPTERKALENPWRQKQEAQAIADGVDAYFARTQK